MAPNDCFPGRADPGRIAVIVVLQVCLSPVWWTKRTEPDNGRCRTLRNLNISGNAIKQVVSDSAADLPRLPLRASVASTAVLGQFGRSQLEAYS
jgi:hypothetical protein